MNIKELKLNISDSFFFFYAKSTNYFNVICDKQYFYSFAQLSKLARKLMISNKRITVQLKTILFCIR